MTEPATVEQKHTLPVYPGRGITLTKGAGARVWDNKGNEYIDCTAGHGVAAIGHANPELCRAITSQCRKLVTCSGTFYNDARSQLINQLMEITPPALSRVFLCNSGTESIEAAIKFTRISSGKTDFICARGSFHGRTLGALSATFNPKYKQGVQPLVPGFHFVSYNDIEAIKTAVNKNTAAIILETIQGEGGVNEGSKEYFREVRSLCSELNILLIIDEVQTGFCRTGYFFGIDHLGIKPDILCLAKAMAGGLPMGAVLTTERIAVSPGCHGSTFGGNPLACAAASATIRYMINNNLAQQAGDKGEYFRQNISKLNLKKIRRIKGRGLMIGLELKEKVQPLIVSLLREGILSLPAGKTVLRLLPPLIISKDDLDSVIEKIALVLGR